MTALAVSTQDSYAAAFRSFERYCLGHGVPGSLFSPTVYVLMGFAAYLKETLRLRAATISSYLAGVRSYCVDFDGEIIAFKHPLLLRMLEGCRRRERATQGPARVRVPITTPVLRAMVRARGRASSTRTIMLAAAMITAFFGLFRAGEITFKGKRYPLLRRADVTWAPDGRSVTIHLRQSKTDIRRRGVAVTLFANDSDICPVAHLRRTWEAAVRKGSEDPLFQNAGGGPLTYMAFLRAVKTWASAAGLPTTAVGTHSLRSGAATSLAKLGLSDYLIKTMGRWTSLCYQRYIALDQADLRRASARLARLEERALAAHPEGNRAALHRGQSSSRAPKNRVHRPSRTR